MSTEIKIKMALAEPLLSDLSNRMLPTGYASHKKQTFHHHRLDINPTIHPLNFEISPAHYCKPVSITAARGGDEELTVQVPNTLWHPALQ